MTLVETIKYTENLAELLENQAQVYEKQGNPMSYLPYKETAKEYKQRAEWLKELKERREIQDILLQFLVDSESDICCADSADDEKECLPGRGIRKENQNEESTIPDSYRCHDAVPSGWLR